MLIANRCKQAELRDAPEHMRSNVGTTGVVAEIFPKFLFAAVWSSEAGLNRDPGHREPLFGDAYSMFSIKRGGAQVTSGQPQQ